MAQNDKKYLRNHISCDFYLWYTCVKWYLQEFFPSKFWKSEKVECHAPYLRNHTPYDCHFWCKSVKWYLQWYISVFSKFWFSGLLWGSKNKKWPKMTRNCLLCLILRSQKSYDLHLWYTYVKGQYLQYLHVFSKF